MTSDNIPESESVYNYAVCIHSVAQFEMMKSWQNGENKEEQKPRHQNRHWCQERQLSIMNDFT